MATAARLQGIEHVFGSVFRGHEITRVHMIRVVPEFTANAAWIEVDQAQRAALGFGAHSDQERILISELNRFVRFNWDIVLQIAAEQ